MRRIPLTAAALAATALAAPAAAQAAPLDQYVAPHPVVKYDQAWTLQANTTQEFRMPLTELGSEAHVLVPCWGLEVKGPGVDIAAASLENFGALPPATVVPGEPVPSYAPTATQQADGTWVIPDSAAALGTPQLEAGADCRAIGWDVFVTGDKASAAARGKAKRTRRPVKVKVKKKATKKSTARRATAAQAGAVNVTLGGLEFARGRSADVVVRITTGDLAGPTTLTTHGRVLLQPKR